MTDTTVLLTSRELIGVTAASSFTEQSPVAPYSATRVLMVNPTTGKLVIVARDDSRAVPAIVAVSPVISPPPTQAHVLGRYVYTMADWTTSSQGQFRKYFSTYLQTPLLTVSDPDAAGPMTLVGDGVVPTIMVHGRSKGAMLVARDLDTFAVIATVLVPAVPTLVISDGLQLYVFCKGQRFVESIRWDSTHARFVVGTPILIPMASTAVDAVFDGSRVVVVAPEHVVVFDVATESALLVHHDNNAGFTSVDAAVNTSSIAFVDGATDPEYIAALWHARFNTGKDRANRDYYTSAEQLSRIASVFGTEQAPNDPITNRIRQRFVRKMGEQWVVFDGRTGRLALSGDLVWRFRGADAAESPQTYTYDEPDAPAGTFVSTETATRARMVWEGTPVWSKDLTGGRFAYFDGTLSAKIGTVKSIFLPSTSTFTFWIRPQAAPAVIARMDLLSQQLSAGAANYIRIWGIPGGAMFFEVQGIVLGGPSSLNVFDDAWHHVAVVYSAAGFVYVYLDGVEVGAQGVVPFWTPAQPLSIAPVYLGRNADGTYHYKGWLGDCRIYRIALSPEAIADLAGHGPGGGGGSGGGSANSLLLETGDSLLLETSDALLLE